MPGKIHHGLDACLYGASRRWRVWPWLRPKMARRAQSIAHASEQWRNVVDAELRSRLAEMKEKFRRRGQAAPDQVDASMALMVEAAERTLGLRPFPVQIMGALVLRYGLLAEMATGEGKSLTACLPAVLAAWSGRPCHVVTVNDYLAGRDAEEFKSFYRFCGVEEGCINAQMQPRERMENYEKGVVYLTSKELVADFLRDRLKIGEMHNPERRIIRQMTASADSRSPEMVMRGLDMAIVDEADSVLIDEAVTPLIISQEIKNRTFVEVCQTARRIARGLESGPDYQVDHKYREIRLTKMAVEKLGQATSQMPGIWRGRQRCREMVLQALTAREFYHRDQEYVVQDGKVVIVDEFTGRLMPNRSWRQGLHQAVEAKEGVEITEPSETLHRLSFQRFFRFFRCLSGMTGTASEAAGELWHIYGLGVVKIPTHRPCIRNVLPDRVFSHAVAKWRAIAEDVIKIHAGGRPVLVGTRSVQDSEHLAQMLQKANCDVNVLNAVRHEKEAQIVAGAGRAEAVTIATNMAGRGTDIKLGPGVAQKGGLHVIGAERHESGRIDRQLFGRCARQGDPGSVQAYVSAEDELIRRFAPNFLRRALLRAVRGKRPWAGAVVRSTEAVAQQLAQRLSFRRRKGVLQYDDWLEAALGFTGGSGKV